MFAITWHPFCLDPSPPKTAVPVIDKLVQKFGIDELERKKEQMRKMGQGEGINFTFGNKIGSTRDAHRLLELGKLEGRQNEVADELFKSYFEEDGDITSHDMLVAAGVESWTGRVPEPQSGSRAETAAMLSTMKSNSQVGRASTVSRSFTINGEFHVDGAQDVETFLTEFVRAKEA